MKNSNRGQNRFPFLPNQDWDSINKRNMRECAKEMGYVCNMWVRNDAGLDGRCYGTMCV